MHPVDFTLLEPAAGWISLAWFPYALASVFIYAALQIVDKFCVDGLFQTVRGWIVATGVFSLVPLSAGLVLHGLPAIPLSFVALMMGAGAVQLVAYGFYARAMQAEGADIIAALWQIVPLYGCLAGFMFLGEVVHPVNLLGALLMAAVTLFLACPRHVKNWGSVLKKPVFLWMQAACVLTIGATLIMNHGAEHVGSDAVFVWFYMGHVIFGVAVAFMRPALRLKDLVAKKKQLGIITLVMVTVQALDGLATYALIKAYEAGPYGMVTALEALQPMVILGFVGLLGLIRHKKLNRALMSLVNRDMPLRTKISAFVGLFIGVAGMML